jgi:predicted transcriptional regulator
MASAFKQFIEGVAGEKAPGPSTTFSVAHIFYAVELVAEKPIGRNKLAEKLSVGDGAIRTIINHLKDAELIETSKAGCTLTAKGVDVWKKFTEFFPQRGEIVRTELTNSEHNYGFLVKNSGHKVKSGIEQRDAAIVAGAKRAVVIVSRGGQLSIESVSKDIAKDFPTATKQILKVIQPEDNDVIVITGAHVLQKAKHAAFAASWALINNDKKK